MILRATAEADRGTLKPSRSPNFLSGREFTAQEIQDLQETVRVFRRLSWKELVRTICEHLDWVTPAGRYKLDSCAKALVKLEARGLVKLPARRRCHIEAQAIVLRPETAPEEEIVGTVREVAPVEVQPVGGKEAIRLWNEYVDRYHPLGYKRPFGAHQRYFLVGARGRRLGCLLFASSAWALGERDHWIGWTERDRAQRLNWVVGNTRLLIFPWVRVKNLASKALSLAAGRIGRDWEQRYGYGPVLLETFVEVQRYRGTCYRAANWIYLGVTQGRGRMDRYSRYQSTARAIYVYPLVENFRSFLQGRNDEQVAPSARTRRAEGGAARPQAGRETVATTAGGTGSEDYPSDHDRERVE